MPINSFSPPRIVIDTNSPVHAESSPHVRRTLDINRESDIHAVAGTPQTPISIHALRKESDPGTLRLTKRSKNFNPHSPCGERPSPPAPSTRRANFNPHSPCGERPCWNIRPNAGSYFNPHSPCEERLKPDLSVLKDMQFQSTLPLRGATSEAVRYELAKLISLHTPLAGSDSANTPPKPEKDTFQSTLPLRGATYSYWISPSVQIFQSTLPLRGATFSMRLVQHIVSISIHTPLAGSDGTARPWSRPCGNFNPHSPCGERQYAYRHPSVKVEISIHTPLAGSDEAGAAVLVKADVISIHTPLAGSDGHRRMPYMFGMFISIHTPLAGSDLCGLRHTQQIP